MHFFEKIIVRFAGRDCDHWPIGQKVQPLFCSASQEKVPFSHMYQVLQRLGRVARTLVHLWERGSGKVKPVYRQRYCG